MSASPSAPSGNEESEDTVSVIIPVYNGQKFIRKAIQSVLEQTYPDIQIVVVNDGSTDATQQIVESEFGGKVTLVSQKNGGLSNARNSGMRASTGKYVAFLDADDWWDPRKVEVQVRELKKNPDAAAHYTGLMLVQESDGTMEVNTPIDAATLWPQLRWGNPGIPPSSVMMKLSLLRELGGFDESIRACEDWVMWFRIVRQSRFVMSTEPLTYYLVSPGGLSGNADFMYDTFMKILDRLLLDGLEGSERALWRRRIISYQEFKACLTARGAGEKAKEKAYMKKSVMTWPSPFWAPERFKYFAVTLLKS
jgi:glycosyltransferase involved in cell wall biosynthesis